MIQPYLEKIQAGEDLTRREAACAVEAIIEERVSATEIGALLMGLHMKGESEDEIAGFVDAMEKYMIAVSLEDPEAIDVCGTGGDGKHTFNVSTTAAIIISAAGVTVAKHGNRSISSKSGSADVLRELGVNIEMSPEQAKKCADEVGLTFFYAPLYHPAMRKVATHRKNLGIRTVFNMIGPLLNPARVRRQLIGTFNRDSAHKLAGVLKRRNTGFACTVHSEDGFDELSPLAKNHLYLISKTEGAIKHQVFEPTNGGSHSLKEIQGNSPLRSAEIILRVLQGERGLAREIAILNSAAGLLIAGKVKDIEGGIGLAEELIDSGAALQKLNDFRKASHLN